jgi:hypothetical protein
MKIFTKLLFFIIIIFNHQYYPQQYFVRGKVINKSGASPISYANIKVMNQTGGTAANKEGEFELKLYHGNYKLIASCIGFNSDTISIELVNNLSDAIISLLQTNIILPEITVSPGENPAIRIIRSAIERKKIRENKLFRYHFDAYTKGILRTQKDIRAKDNSLNIGLGKDTSALKITGILESETKGYYKKPEYYKEEIIARRQSSNFPPSLNILAGGRIVKNFYDDQINLLGRGMPGPLANNALEYYDYYVRNILAIDHKVVYQIFIYPKDQNDPGFTGNLFIIDSTFDLIKVELQINRAANIGGIFDSLIVFQQFSMIEDSIYMPIDYRLFANVNVLNLAKIGFELNTILYNYNINSLTNDILFSKAVITVLPHADGKDSSYWENATTIPNTLEEQAAYKRIDSLNSVYRTFWDKISPLSSKITLFNNFSISAPIGMYHFNRVEGHALDFGFFLNDAFDQRLNSSLQSSYGFSDQTYKTIFGASYLFGDYRTYKIAFNAYNKLTELFGNSDNYNDLTSTVLALFTKYEFRDYYYTKGFALETSDEIFPILNLNAGFINHNDNSATKNSDFSFFDKNKQFSNNPAIYETKINALTASFNFDFRDYIEDGLFRRRISQGESYATFGGDILYADKTFLNSDIDLTIYKMNINGMINTFNSAQLNFKIFGMITNGALPYQMLYSLPGNINSTGQNFTFRTLNLNEVLGSRVLTINIEHFFGDELFRFSKIPGIKNWELQLTGFFNAAYSNVNDKSISISPDAFQKLTHPFYEIGFGIGQILSPIQLDFAWRLNYRGENNFRIGINTFIIE